MQSCLYHGRIRHRRFEPKAHSFNYPVCYAYLDLDELDNVFKGRWFWSTKGPAPVRFQRRDYLGNPGIPLQTAVRDHIRRETGHTPDGPIRLLTHLRHFGFSFNPVSFYYCFDARSQCLETIVAEITNTPWNERHAYVLPRHSSLTQTKHLRFRFGKAFHVSPFMPMDIQYDWTFGIPDTHLSVHMQNFRHNRSIFDATLILEREPINGMSCARELAGYPLMPMKVLGAIYWQALKLFLKRVPIFTHPSKIVQNPQGGARSADSL